MNANTMKPAAVSNANPGDFARRSFHDPQAGAATRVHEEEVLRLLKAQDGSTTRLCEAIAGGPIALLVLRQGVTAEVPVIVRTLLPGERFIERHSCLAADGEIMMDNLTYVALNALAPQMRAALEGGSAPIGHLLESLWVRRQFLPAEAALPLFERLWSVAGTPDAAASRAYCIGAPEGAMFVIAETYRRGMRDRRLRSQGAPEAHGR